MSAVAGAGGSSANLRLTFTNLSRADTFVGMFPDHCLMLYHREAYEEGRWDEPAYDKEPNPLYFGCPAVGTGTVRVAPGDSVWWTWYEEILDDSLPSGSYRVGAHGIPVESMPDTLTFDEWWRSTDRIELVAPEPIELQR